jgi:IS30 family transposase
MKKYRRITLDDRRIIEESLDKGLSFAKTAQLIDKSTSVVAHEVKTNRTLVKTKVANAPCREQEHCKRTLVCQKCPTPGTVCARCESTLCKEVCACHLEIAGCAKTTSAPWVCNGCRKLKYGCNRPGRYRYVAAVADKASKERRTDARRGVNKTAEEFDRALGIIRPALSRRLSPYEIATLYAEQLKVSSSTLYRWVERGYGGMANIELERKVGFKPRKQHKDRRITHHGRSRSYAAFLGLAQDEQDGCVEMDTVMGKKTDTRCLLTLYIRPAHFQLYVLLEEKTIAKVVRVFDLIERTSRRLFSALFSVLLTD